MRIGVDLDGVCVNYLEALRHEGAKHNITLSSLPPTNYAMLGDGWFESKEQWLSIHHEVMRWADQFHPLIAPHVFHHLDGHDVVAVTSRTEDHSELTRKWIDYNLPGVFTDVIFTDNKHVHGMDVLIDDNPYVVDSGDTPVVMVDYPYNRGVDSFMRVSSPQAAIVAVGNLKL